MHGTKNTQWPHIIYESLPSRNPYKFITGLVGALCLPNC